MMFSDSFLPSVVFAWHGSRVAALAPLTHASAQAGWFEKLSDQKRKLDGRAEATLIATAGSDAPEGHAEDVLDVYELPYHPLHLQVCYDEWPRALIGETRVSLPARPGMHKRVDNE
jgi:hypothetical protein